MYSKVPVRDQRVLVCTHKAFLDMAKRGYFGVNHRTGLTQGSQGLTMEGQGQNPKTGKNGKGPSWAPRGPQGGP